MKTRKYLKPSVIFSELGFIESLADDSIISNYLQMPDEWNQLEGDDAFH